MILQDEFKNNGYKDVLVGEIASEYEINLEDIFELHQKPEELLGIFISEQRDDLFFLLDGDLMEINSLCDCWDDRIAIPYDSDRCICTRCGTDEAIKSVTSGG